MAIKFSVVIPTRSRAVYLKACLQSVVVAADNAGCEVEILVSDNASDDNTKEIVEQFANPAIQYIFRPKRLSMRMNFEASLRDATGTHIVFIGDDDAVLPNGLSALRCFLEQSQADVVNWRLPGYVWPDSAQGSPGHMKIAPGKLSGRARKVDVDATLAKILSGRFRSYHDGPVIYHGCVARSIVEIGRAKSEGTYFWCSSPDVFASMRNLMISGVNYWKLDLPITLGGASPRSNGMSGQRMSHETNKTATGEFQRFIEEAKDDPCNGQLPTDCPSLSLMTLDALQMALKFEGRQDKIDTEAWRDRITSEVASMTQVHRDICEKHTELLLGTPISFPKVNQVAKPKYAAPNPSRALKGWPARTTLIGGPAMENVALASEALDEICHLGARAASPSVFERFQAMIRTAIRARDAVRQVSADTA